MAKKLANNILLVGGGTKLKCLHDVLEDRLIAKIPKVSGNIERVEVVVKDDGRLLTWMGASIVPKIESSKDMFVARDKWNVEFVPYCK